MIKFLLIVLGVGLPLLAQKPLLELGVGVAAVRYPAYIGAKKEKYFGVAFPYINYRGEWLEIDNGGVKKELFDIDGLGLELSASGSFPVDSASSKLREGMADLDLMFEIGGMGSYALWDKDDYHLLFRLPLRAVISTNFHSRLDYRGVVANPEVKFSQKNREGELFVNTGAVFASSEYHDYLYGVENIYKTEQREVYQGRGGYGGWRSKMGFSQRKKAWVYDAYVVHYFLRGAVFEDSPLLERENAFFIQASLSYIFYTR